MQRREFLQKFATSLAGGCVSGIGALPALAGAEQSWKTDFARALRKKPWLLGFKGTNKNFPRVELEVSGRLPRGLEGVFYRNGPAQHEIGDMRYHHFFDGDGMVHAFRFNAGKVTHEGRFVETAKYLEEKKAGRALEQGFGTALPFMKPPGSAETLNTANINIIEHNGELLALWEGASAYRLDGETLDTLGLKTWSEQTAGAPFSAHPRVDSDGTLWNFGYNTQPGAVVIYRISADGKLRDIGLHPMGNVPMIHDFMITEHYLIFLLNPYTFDPEKRGSFLEHFVWKPEDGGRAMVVSKDSLSEAQFVDMPPFWCFHIANAYEDGAHKIRFHAPIHQDVGAMDPGYKDIMRGDDASIRHSKIDFKEGVIDLRRRVVEFENFAGTEFSEFPRIDPRRNGKKHRYNFLMQTRADAQSGYFNRLQRIDNVSAKMKAFNYPDNYVADEHIYVADPTSTREGVGWVLGTVLDYATGKSALNVFDARHIEDGPIAHMQMEYPVPLGLHGNFVHA